MEMKSLITDPGAQIAYYADLVPFIGTVNATLVFCQLVYWNGKQHDPHGWIRKESREMREETGLSKDQQETARKRLRKLGLMEEKRKGTPRRLHFRIKIEAFHQAWEEYRLKRGDSPQLKRRKKATRTGLNTTQRTSIFPAYISESTHETTQKSTSETEKPSSYSLNQGKIERETRLKGGRSQQGGWSSFEKVAASRKAQFEKLDALKKDEPL